jgi:UDP-glucose:tetrahydrobiopterin glucosyltransferase
MDADRTERKSEEVAPGDGFGFYGSLRACRILIVAPPVGPIGSGEAGGVETHLLGLVPILVERGHTVGVVAPAGSSMPGVTLYQVAGEMSLSATRAERDAATVARTGAVLENMWDLALRLQRDYDVVAGVSYDWLPFYLTPFFSTPVGHWISICSAMDEVDRIIEKRWREGGLKLAMYTGAQARTYAFLESERVHLLYGGVDTRVFQYNAQPTDRLCWAGRISPEKGLEDAIAVARALDMPLDVCGKIQDEAYWQAVMRDAGAQVVYHGFLGPAELQRRYAIARATLVTPHWIEAFGNTVIESLACGTPVVAYGIGGPAEIVEHGRSGILVPWAAGVEGLAEGVREAVRLNRGVVRARAEEFSFVRMADRFEEWVGLVAAGVL